jgi:hypothetical protein
LVDRRKDFAFLARRGRFERGAGAARIGDDRDAIVGVELIEQQAERFLDERQLVVCVHRSRCVDQENQIGARPRRTLDRIAFDPDADELAPGRERAGEDRDIRGERLLRGARRGIVIGEIVDQLLGPHRRGLGQDISG